METSQKVEVLSRWRVHKKKMIDMHELDKKLSRMYLKLLDYEEAKLAGLNPKSPELKALDTDTDLNLGPNERMTKKKTENAILTYFKKKEKELLKEIQALYESDKLSQVKSIPTLLARLKAIIKDTFTPESMKTAIEAFVKDNYARGLGMAESGFQMNFFPDQPTIDALKDYNFDLVKNMTEELANKLSTTLQRAYISDMPYSKVVEEVKQLFNNNEVRAKAIVRTEQNRAENQGRLDGAKQSKVSKGKSIVGYQDEKTSPLCNRMLKKYGNKNIELDEQFHDDLTGQSWNAPPFHVNCRTRLTTPRRKE